MREITRLRYRITLALLLFFSAAASSLPARLERLPMQLDVDASSAAQRLIRVHLRIPAPSRTPVSRDMMLSYPKWNRGEHAPTGHVSQIGSLSFHSGERTLSWRRDLVDQYAFHLTLPEGSSAVDVHFTYLLPSLDSSAASSTARLLMLRWNTVLLYATGVPVRDMPVVATLRLPPGWQYATALPVANQRNGTLTFQTASLETLVDSPVLAGQFMRKITLTQSAPINHELDVAAESEADLPSNPLLLNKFKHLILQSRLLFGTEHFRSYHFLVAASDFLAAGGGVEHHESSDDRVRTHFFQDPDLQIGAGSFLPHEYIHSWNGKYRVPADLYTPDFQTPERTDLLWVYEGATEYLADVLAARSGFSTIEQALDFWAADAADVDHQTGRTWRSLQDTIDSVPVTMLDLFSSPPGWRSWLRAMDYYKEGALIWLEANAIVEQQSGGARSLDAFFRLFFGGRGGAPNVKTYTKDDVLAALGRITPYPWAKFFEERLNSLSPRAPLGGLERSGWRLVYNHQPNLFLQASHRVGPAGMYSIGCVPSNDGQITDVIQGSPAEKAGLFPGMTITAINGVKWSPELFLKILTDSTGTTAPLRFTTEYAAVTQEVSLRYTAGMRHPHLERIPGKADLLTPLFSLRSNAS